MNDDLHSSSPEHTEKPVNDSGPWRTYHIALIAACRAASCVDSKDGEMSEWLRSRLESASAGVPTPENLVGIRFNNLLRAMMLPMLLLKRRFRRRSSPPYTVLTQFPIQFSCVSLRIQIVSMWTQRTADVAFNGSLMRRVGSTIITGLFTCG